MNIVTVICACALFGCDNSSACFLAAGGEIQESPSGKAVAFVHPTSFDLIANGTDDDSQLPVCAIEEFFETYSNAPITLIVVLDLEDDRVALTRLFREHGYDINDEDGFSDVPADELDELLDVFFAMQQPPTTAFNTGLRINAQGIGSRNVVPLLGPESLESFVFLPTRESVVAGRFLHEFAHNWGVYLDGPVSLSSQAEQHGGHWGFSGAAGILGGWDEDALQDEGDGLYVGNVAPAGRAQNTRPYSALELYLMGLAPACEVEPIDVATAVTAASQLDDGTIQFRANELTEVSIEDIIQANGPRIPSYGDADKQFCVAMLVLTDHQLSAEEWDFYERSIEFMEATSGVSLSDQFPEDQYPAHASTWWLSAIDDELPFMNFFASTNGRGTMLFETLLAE